MLRPYVLALFATTLLVCCPEANSQQLAANCGSLTNAFGPFDYTNARHRAENLKLVEDAHFDAGVAALRGHAKHPRNLPGDIDYTLRAFPNHHRALHTMARYYLTREDYGRPALRYTAECYFDRAMTLNSKDGMVRMIYGIYLYKLGKMEESTQRFREALERSPNSAELHYNFGLVLAEQKNFADAKKHAEIAYEMGHPMPGLRNKLKRAGVW